MRYRTLAPILLAVACSTGPTGPNAQQSGKDEIVIPYGETVVVPGSIVEVGFHALIGDSRCPSDVLCIWEGEGTVELGLTVGDGPTVSFEVTVGETIHHVGRSFTLVRLDPYPLSTRPHVPEDYVVHLRVSAGVSQPQ
jgi:hypothetical protein